MHSVVFLDSSFDRHKKTYSEWNGKRNFGMKFTNHSGIEESSLQYDLYHRAIGYFPLLLRA